MLGLIDLTLVKRLILLYWASWLSVVASTNLLDALRALGWLPEWFRLVSGNWAWINRVMDPLAIPRGLQAFSFGGVIAWELAGAMLFWRAVAAYRGRALSREPEALAACGINLALWGVFQVLDEVVLAYPPEAVHRVIFIEQIATIVLLNLSADPRGGAALERRRDDEGDETLVDAGQARRF